MVSFEEYSLAKKVRRISSCLILLAVFVIPVFIALFVKKISPGNAMLVSFISLVADFILLGLIGTYDAIEESRRTIEKYKKGF